MLAFKNKTARKAKTKTEEDKETGKTKTVPKHSRETIEKMINRKFGSK